jgi:hypothetical protein
MRDMYLEEVKAPAQSKYPFDYFKVLAFGQWRQPRQFFWDRSGSADDAVHCYRMP